ncbi:odorant receptor Or2-like [Fopius arisanus]|uniref:Odorant receptor n=1 Tax=Fopius arisanus TaxID=64838 RepID=A0A9R1T3T2_9HYME|nr:PREDICTED: odorant receptor Or2-like [Fopius arisanus]
MTFDRQEILPVRITYSLLFLAGFGTPTTDQERRTLTILLIYTLWTIFFGGILIFIDAYYVWGSFEEMLYTAVNIMTVLICGIKFISTVLQRTRYENFLRLARESLWKQAESDDDKKVMEKCTKQALIFVCAFVMLAGGSGVLYILEAIYYNLVNDITNFTSVRERAFIMKLWCDWPFYEAPKFHLMFLVQSFTIMHYGLLYCCFENFLVLTNIFLTGQFTILKYRLEVLNSELTTGRIDDGRVGSSKDSLNTMSQEFKNCIKQHQFLIKATQQLEELYTLKNLASIMAYSSMICLSGYQTMTPGNPLVRKIKYGIYVTGCLSQLFCFTFTCDELSLGSVSVSDGPYNSGWYGGNWSEKGRSLTKDLSIMIMRAQRPCRLTAGGFFNVTLNILKSVLTTAFSYLTLIRQSAK